MGIVYKVSHCDSVLYMCNNNLSELNVVNSQLDADDDDFTLDF